MTEANVYKSQFSLFGLQMVVTFRPDLRASLQLLGLLGAVQLWLASEWGNSTGAAIGCLAVFLGLGMQLLQWTSRTRAWADGRGRVLLKG
jgi:protein-S-isoprenylcysteine O-methyltransferase Ste14